MPAFMSGRHILASFSVIILSQDSGRLCAGSSCGHASLCFHALIGCSRKEGCISLTLPASCCVQQQFKATPSTFSVEPRSFLSLDFALLSRNPLITCLSSESFSFMFRQCDSPNQGTQTHSPSSWSNRLIMNLQCSCFAARLLMGGLHWNAS